MTQTFYLKGNNTGIARVDGVALGAKNVAGSFTGFGLPYGQKPTKFGLDTTSNFVYAGETAAGQCLYLGAFPNADGTAAIKPATQGQAGQTPIQCTVVVDVLLCNVNVNGALYHDLELLSYTKNQYELGISPSGALGPIVSLVLSDSA